MGFLMGDRGREVVEGESLVGPWIIRVKELGVSGLRGPWSVELR